MQSFYGTDLHVINLQAVLNIVPIEAGPAGIGYSLRDSMGMPVLTIPSMPTFASSTTPSDDIESGANVALLSNQQSGNQ